MDVWGDVGAGFGYLGLHGPVSDVSVSLEIARFKWDSIHKHFVNDEALRRWKALFTRLTRALGLVLCVLAPNVVLVLLHFVPG